VTFTAIRGDQRRRDRNATDLQARRIRGTRGGPATSPCQPAFLGPQVAALAEIGVTARPGSCPAVSFEAAEAGHAWLLFGEADAVCVREALRGRPGPLRRPFGTTPRRPA